MGGKEVLLCDLLYLLLLTRHCSFWWLPLLFQNALRWLSHLHHYSCTRAPTPTASRCGAGSMQPLATAFWIRLRTQSLWWLGRSYLWGRWSTIPTSYRGGRAQVREKNPYSPLTLNPPPLALSIFRHSSSPSRDPSSPLIPRSQHECARPRISTARTICIHSPPTCKLGPSPPGFFPPLCYNHEPYCLRSPSDCSGGY